jgi:4a-hydroxytetrahydrobiopterin dehydratase
MEVIVSARLYFPLLWSLRMMIEKLSKEQVETGLEALSEWTLNGESIQRTFGFDDFIGAIAFVTRVAERAEIVQHHPDILVRYNKVTLTLSTHDAGGLSSRDLEFAKVCDQLATN